MGCSLEGLSPYPVEYDFYLKVNSVRMELNSLTPCLFTIIGGVGRTPPHAEIGIQKPNLQILCLFTKL